MWERFDAEYLARSSPYELLAHHTDAAEGDVDRLAAQLAVGGEQHEIEGAGNGPIAAFCTALSTIGADVRVLDYAEHALSAGGDARAAAYLECAVGDRVLWGIGVDPNIVTASLKAVTSALNRAAGSVG
jgi:2-isopropylmalate synthase